MPKLLNVFCVNDNNHYQIQAGTSLKELIDIIKPQTKFQIVGALVNNRVS